MSAWNDVARKDAGSKALTKQWIADYAPLTYVYADTKVGKTTWVGKLMTSGAYTPTLWIDVDSGSATVSHLVDDERRCHYWECDTHPDKARAWLINKLVAAEHHDCNAIVIEGLNFLYENMLAKEQRDSPSQEDPFQLAKVPSGHMRGLLAQIRNLKQARKANGKAVPIFVTLNCKMEVVGKGEAAQRYLVPNMSDGLRRRVGEGADALLELTRTGDRTMLTAYDSSANPRHAIRGPTGASNESLAKLVGEQNLDPVGFLARWADFVHRNIPQAKPRQTREQPQVQ